MSDNADGDLGEVSFQSADEGGSQSAVAELECDAATSEAGLGGISYDELGPPWADLFVAEPDISVEHVVGIQEFLRPGGGWGGAEAPVLRAIAIGRKHGLLITSLKRHWGSTGSDHHLSQVTSYAADMSNGRAPTPEMDRTAAEIAQNLGVPNYRGGYVLNRSHGRARGQLIWRWTGHFNHVHYGVRITR